MPLRRLQLKTTKEILWIYLLRLLMDREMYAYEIREELRKKFGFEPALITPYVVLYRLENDGYVTAVQRDKKKYYKITAKGKTLLKNGKDRLRELVKKLS